MIPPSGPGRQAALAKLEQTTRSLTRISLIDDFDVNRAADLLEVLFLHPDAASSITEIIFCINPVEGGTTRGPPALLTWKHHEAHADADIGDYVLLEQCILSLKCGSDSQAAGLRSVYERAGSTSVPSEDADLKPKFPVRRNDAVAILLLWMCTNLETLRLGTKFTKHLHLEQYLTLVNYGRLPGLTDVQHVEFVTPKDRAQDEREFDELQFGTSLQTIHRLPKLESILMEGVCKAYDSTYPWFVPRCGNMTRLELSHVDLGYDAFATLVSVPKELEELKLSLGGLIALNGNPVWLPQYVSRMLSCHKNTLTSLDIDTEIVVTNHGHYWWGDDKYPSPRHIKREEKEPVYKQFREDDTKVSAGYAHESIKLTKEDCMGTIYGSFADFKALKHLRIGIKSLLGLSKRHGDPANLPDLRLVAMLPSSLESFALYGYERGDNEDVDGQVDEFMQKRETLFPSLVDMEGIEEKIDSIDDLYGCEPDDGEGWDRGEQDWGWK